MGPWTSVLIIKVSLLVRCPDFSGLNVYTNTTGKRPCVLHTSLCLVVNSSIVVIVVIVHIYTCSLANVL